MTCQVLLTHHQERVARGAAQVPHLNVCYFALVHIVGLGTRPMEAGHPKVVHRQAKHRQCATQRRHVVTALPEVIAPASACCCLGRFPLLSGGCHSGFHGVLTLTCLRVRNVVVVR